MPSLEAVTPGTGFADVRELPSNARFIDWRSAAVAARSRLAMWVPANVGLILNVHSPEVIV